MKIVIPTDKDKKTIFKRTGQAPFFVIYEDDRFIKAVENQHAKHPHHHHSDENQEEEINHHIKDMQNLKGCDVILVKVVGKHMSAALNSIGLKIVKIDSNLTYVDEVLENFLKQ